MDRDTAAKALIEALSAESYTIRPVNPELLSITPQPSEALQLERDGHPTLIVGIF